MISYSILGVVEVPGNIGKYFFGVLAKNLRWSTLMVVRWFLSNWLCTTVVMITFCAGLLFGCLKYSGLCTTEFNFNLCADLLSWLFVYWQIILVDDMFDLMGCNSISLNSCTLFPWIKFFPQVLLTKVF